MEDLQRTLGPGAELFRGHKASMCSALLASGAAGIVGAIAYLALAVAGHRSFLPLVPGFVFLSIVGTLRAGPPPVG